MSEIITRGIDQEILQTLTGNKYTLDDTDLSPIPVKIENWLKTNCKGNYGICTPVDPEAFDAIWFENIDDAIAFRLTWID